MSKSALKKIQTANFTWINVINPSKVEAAELKRRFQFTDLDLTDMLPPLQRPKLTENENYFFLTLLFPVYNRGTRRIHPVEVDFFIGQNFLVSVMSEELFSLENFFIRALKGKKDVVEFLDRTPAYLLAALLESLEKYCHPITVHVGNDIDAVENKIFVENKKETLQAINEILLIKTNIVNFRKAMNRHSKIIYKLASRLDRFFPASDWEPYLKDIIDRAEDTWALLEDYANTIDALHETHSSLLNVRANSVMQTFTIFTSLIFSATLITELLRIQEIDFRIIISVILAVSAGMLIYFRKRKWF